MSTKTFQLTITRVDGPLFVGEATSVQVPGISGDMTILPHHTALISPLRAGVVTVTDTAASTKEFPVVSGTLEVSDNQVTILL